MGIYLTCIQCYGGHAGGLGDLQPHKQSRHNVIYGIHLRDCLASGLSGLNTLPR